ncbi:chromate transporter [uncultured Clostridium sp.]|uniref:chromate transporter n=1 Tax=uncultured Clostridium sp. TaxID=59620 RepID=UPI0028EC9F28|nr:chromate transporter [uncultured Clostridium sp.]
MKELLDLFWTFCRIGGLTFGGGYAMLPMIQEEVVERRKWATEEEIMNYYAVGQCTPGIIAVNTATFIGYKTKGILGGIFATLGVVFPSLIIIMIIAGLLNNFNDIEIIKNVFGGIRVAALVLVINAIVKLWKSSIKDSLGVIVVIFAFFMTAILKISPIYIVIASAITGIVSKLIRGELK